MKAANQSYSIWAVACAHPFYPVAAENAHANRYIYDGPIGAALSGVKFARLPANCCRRLLLQPLISRSCRCCVSQVVPTNLSAARTHWCHPKIIRERRSGPLGGRQRRRTLLSRSLPSCSVTRLRLSAGSRATEENCECSELGFVAGLR